MILIKMERFRKSRKMNDRETPKNNGGKGVAIKSYVFYFDVKIATWNM